MRSRKLFLTLCLLLLAGNPVLFAVRDRQVDRAEKLRYVEQSTGTSLPVRSSTDSFQTRLDAVMDVNASRENTYVSTQDEDMRRARAAAVLQETLVTDNDRDRRHLTPYMERKDKSDQPDRVDRSSKIDRSLPGDKVDNSENAYQKDMDDWRKEQDDRQARQYEKRPLGSAAEEKAASSQGEGLSPALSNNPFYFKGAVEETKKFDDDRPVILSRLVEKGFKEDDAESMVRQASSPEELILMLMQEKDYTYGEAADTVNG